MQNKFIRTQNATKDIPSFYIPKRCLFKLFLYFSFVCIPLCFFSEFLLRPHHIPETALKKHHKPNMQLYEPLIKLILLVTKLSNLMQSMKRNQLGSLMSNGRVRLTSALNFLSTTHIWCCLHSKFIHLELLQTFHSFQVLIDTINVVFKLGK